MEGMYEAVQKNVAERLKEHEGNITVSRLLREHMKFLTDRAVDAKGNERDSILETMENLQCLMNRLSIDVMEPWELAFSESRVATTLTWDSKVLIITMMDKLTRLNHAIYHLISKLDDNPKRIEKIRRWVCARLLRVFSFFLTCK
jgi:hypothetical protein